MTPADSQLETRLPVWSALSELFLDTELQPDDLERVASVLAKSPYSEAKIEEILRFEVSPILKWNLLQVAGEWGMFDEDWLREKLAGRIDRKPPLKFPIFWMIREEWLEVKALVLNLRDKSGQSMARQDNN